MHSTHTTCVLLPTADFRSPISLLQVVCEKSASQNHPPHLSAAVESMNQSQEMMVVGEEEARPSIRACFLVSFSKLRITYCVLYKNKFIIYSSNKAKVDLEELNGPSWCLGSSYPLKLILENPPVFYRIVASPPQTIVYSRRRWLSRARVPRSSIYSKWMRGRSQAANRFPRIEHFCLPTNNCVFLLFFFFFLQHLSNSPKS